MDLFILIIGCICLVASILVWLFGGEKYMKWYYQIGEIVLALNEWVISKNLQEDNPPLISSVLFSFVSEGQDRYALYLAKY